MGKTVVTMTKTLWFTIKLFCSITIAFHFFSFLLFMPALCGGKNKQFGVALKLPKSIHTMQHVVYSHVRSSFAKWSLDLPLWLGLYVHQKNAASYKHFSRAADCCYTLCGIV